MMVVGAPTGGLVAQVASPAAAGPPDPDTLVLDAAEALRIGLAARAELGVARASVGVAEAERVAAATYPYNPTVEAKAPGLLSSGGLEGLEVVASQELEWAGQGGLRRASADADLAAARFDLDQALRVAERVISAAFAAAVAADRRVDVLDRSAALAERLRDAVARQLAAGQVSRLDSNLARMTAGRTRSAALAAHRTRDSLRVILAFEVGVDPARPLRPVADSTLPAVATEAPDVLVAEALARRPERRALTARIQAAEARIQLARRATLPNLSVGGVAQRGVGNEGAISWGVRAGLTLPFWNRNTGGRERAAAELRLLESRRDVLDIQIRSEVRTALDGWRSARAEWELLRNEVVGPARENRGLLDTAYEEGQMDLPTYLVFQDQLMDSELAYVAAWLSAHRAAAILSQVRGR